MWHAEEARAASSEERIATSGKMEAGDNEIDVLSIQILWMDFKLWKLL